MATNAGGIKVISILTRDWVAGMRVVTGEGQLIDCNAGLVKNATDTSSPFNDRFEGTLGLIYDRHVANELRPQQVMVVGVPDFVNLLVR